jgi:hypothetical protein
MLCVTAKVIAAVAVAAIGGASVTAESAHMPVSASRHGSEHFTFMATFVKAGDGRIGASIIATGLFTDGGTINLHTLRRSAQMKLGRGTIRLTTTGGSGTGTKVNPSTCLTTLTSSGTYKLSHGTGRYAGIGGSGHFTAAVHSVLARKRDGTCVLNRDLAYQAVVTLTGTATLRR